MKGLLSLVALVLLLIWVPSGNIMSLDTPFPQEGNYGNGGGGPDGGGDDHPFGGESPGDGGSITDNRVTIRITLGIPSLDILYYLPGVNSLVQRFFLIETTPQVGQSEESAVVRNSDRATGNERVQR
jgi:hypothetical protein